MLEIKSIHFSQYYKIHIVYDTSATDQVMEQRSAAQYLNLQGTFINIFNVCELAIQLLLQYILVKVILISSQFQ